jgi:hypothetical protein
MAGLRRARAGQILAAQFGPQLRHIRRLAAVGRGEPTKEPCFIFGDTSARCSSVALRGSENLPCAVVFAAGQRPTEVVGPLLEDEAAELQADFWSPPWVGVIALKAGSLRPIFNQPSRRPFPQSTRTWVIVPIDRMS